MATGTPDYQRSITTSDLQDNSVTTPKLAASAVTAAKVAADVATQAELDAHAALSKSSAHPGTIGTADLADDAVDAAKLRDDAVTDANRAVTTNHIRDGAVTAAKVAADVATQAELDAHAALSKSSAHPGTIGTADLADNGVTDAKLRDGAATSVIGRSAGTSGDPGDIAASADGQVLRRSAGALGFGQVTDAEVAAGAAIAESKLNLASDAAAGTASRRSLGTGPLQAAAGNHTHTFPSILGGRNNTTAVGAGANVFGHPNGLMDANGGTEDFVKMTVPSAGTLRKLRFRLGAAGGGLGGGEIGTFAVRVNGADSALLVTWVDTDAAGTEKSDDDTVSVAAGDEINVRLSHNGAGSRTILQFTWSLEYVPS